MVGTGGVKAKDHGLTEGSVLAILAEALRSFPQPPAPTGPSELQMQAVVGKACLSGTWSGFVTLHVPVPVASSLTSALFAIPAGEISAADRADVVAELCNVVAGNLKGLIGGSVALSLPTTLEGSSELRNSQIPSGSGTIVVDVVFPFLGLPIAVRIIECSAP